MYTLEHLTLGLRGMTSVDKQRADIKRIVAFLHQFPLQGIERATKLWEACVLPGQQHEAFRLWMSAPAYHTGDRAKFWLDFTREGAGVITAVSLDLSEDEVPKRFVSKTWRRLPEMIGAVAVFNQDVRTEFDSWVELGRQAQAT